MPPVKWESLGISYIVHNTHRTEMAALSKVLELPKWERLSKQIAVQSMVSMRSC